MSDVLSGLRERNEGMAVVAVRDALDVPVFKVADPEGWPGPGVGLRGPKHQHGGVRLAGGVAPEDGLQT